MACSTACATFAASVSWLDFGRRQRLDDLALAARRYGAIAEERRQNTVVAEVLAPRFERVPPARLLDLN